MSSGVGMRLSHPIKSKWRLIKMVQARIQAGFKGAEWIKILDNIYSPARFCKALRYFGQRTFNPLVVGSIPTRPTSIDKGFRGIWQIILFRNSAPVPQFALFGWCYSLTFSMPDIPVSHFFIHMSELVFSRCHACLFFLVSTCFGSQIPKLKCGN